MGEDIDYFVNMMYLSQHEHTSSNNHAQKEIVNAYKGDVGTEKILTC